MHNTVQAIKAGCESSCPQAHGLPLVGGQNNMRDKSTLLQMMVDGTVPKMAPHKFTIQEALCGL